MIVALIGIIAVVGFANIWYYENRVLKTKPKVLSFVGFKFKEKR